VWITTDDNGQKNIGQLDIKNGKSSVKTSTPFTVKDIFTPPRSQEAFLIQQGKISRTILVLTNSIIQLHKSRVFFNRKTQLFKQ
jgi:hypothetical protein